MVSVGEWPRLVAIGCIFSQVYDGINLKIKLRLKQMRIFILSTKNRKISVNYVNKYAKVNSEFAK